MHVRVQGDKNMLLKKANTGENGVFLVTYTLVEELWQGGLLQDVPVLE
jgi:hypothetical protein